MVGIDISATKEEIRDTLAKEGSCKAKDVQGRGPLRPKRSWLRVDARPGWGGEETGPGWQGPHKQVDSEDQGHRAKTSSIIQVPRDRARKEDVHLQGGQGAPVLQVSQGMHCRKPEMSALRGARGTVGAQDGDRPALLRGREREEPPTNLRPQVVKSKARRRGVPQTLSPRARRSARRTPWKR